MPGRPGKHRRMAPFVHILIPAAGASRRMEGRDKLLEKVFGKPLLRHVVETALSTGEPVLVALPVDAPERRAVLTGLSARVIEVPDADRGMSKSLVRGAHAIAGSVGDGLMILPADMPDFTPAALRQMIRAFRTAPECIIRGSTAQGMPGHPVIFPHRLWPEFQHLEADEGARGVLMRHAASVRLLPLPGDMASIDLDTPADWAAWRKRQGQTP